MLTKRMLETMKKKYCNVFEKCWNIFNFVIIKSVGRKFRMVIYLCERHKGAPSLNTRHLSTRRWSSDPTVPVTDAFHTTRRSELPIPICSFLASLSLHTPARRKHSRDGWCALFFFFPHLRRLRRPAPTCFVGPGGEIDPGHVGSSNLREGDHLTFLAWLDLVLAKEYLDLDCSWSAA
jgi:hypothetical protein